MVQHGYNTRQIGFIVMVWNNKNQRSMIKTEMKHWKRYPTCSSMADLRGDKETALFYQNPMIAITGLTISINQIQHLI